MPDGLVAGAAGETHYTLTPTMVRNISRPRGICESDSMTMPVDLIFEIEGF
jgi:hypothetical protein